MPGGGADDIVEPTRPSDLLGERTMNIFSRIRTVLALAVDNWASRAYLAVIAATTVWVVCDTLFVEHADPSMAAVVPWLLTAPLSLLYTLLPGDGFGGAEGGAALAVYVAGIALAASANAALIGFAVRRTRLFPRRTATGS